MFSNKLKSISVISKLKIIKEKVFSSLKYSAQISFEFYGSQEGLEMDFLTSFCEVLNFKQF